MRPPSSLAVQHTTLSQVIDHRFGNNILQALFPSGGLFLSLFPDSFLPTSHGNLVGSTEKVPLSGELRYLGGIGARG